MYSKVYVLYLKTFISVADDIWSLELVEALDSLHLKILATTRNPAIFKQVTLPRTEVLVSPSSFTGPEARSLLSSYLAIDPKKDSLPIEVNDIIHLCDGLPLMLSIIGSLLSEHPDRLKFFLLWKLGI